MNTVNIWLLVAVFYGTPAGSPVVLERFASGADCGAAMLELKQPKPDWRPRLEFTCIPAKVVRP